MITKLLRKQHICFAVPRMREGSWNLLRSLNLAEVLNGELRDPRGDPSSRVVVPGDPSRSMLLERISMRGGGQMPPLASHLVDTQAVTLVTAWIDSLAGWEDYDTWSINRFGAVEPRDGDVDLDRFSNYGEYLLQLDGNNPDEYWGLDGVSWSNGVAHVVFPAPADVSVQVEWKADAASPGPWRLLESMDNRPHFPANPGMRTIRDPHSEPARIYRGRIAAP